MWRRIAAAAAASWLLASCTTEAGDVPRAAEVVTSVEMTTTTETVTVSVVTTTVQTETQTVASTPSVVLPDVGMFACVSYDLVRLFQVVVDHDSFSGTTTWVSAHYGPVSNETDTRVLNTWGTIDGNAMTIWIGERPPIFGVTDDGGFTIQETSRAGGIMTTRCDISDATQWNWVVENFRDDVAARN